MIVVSSAEEEEPEAEKEPTTSQQGPASSRHPYIRPPDLRPRRWGVAMRTYPLVMVLLDSEGRRRRRAAMLNISWSLHYGRLFAKESPAVTFAKMHSRHLPHGWIRMRGLWRGTRRLPDKRRIAA